MQRREFITRLDKGATMHRTILTTISLLVLATTNSSGGDLPTRYAPPPVINGGPGTKVGVLDCRLAPSVGLIVVEFQNMECRFTPDMGGPFEVYEGTMSTIGGALGFTTGGALTWGCSRRPITWCLAVSPGPMWVPAPMPVLS
jgi:Protein of unknown function (DUF992)